MFYSKASNLDPRTSCKSFPTTREIIGAHEKTLGFLESLADTYYTNY